MPTSQFAPRTLLITAAALTVFAFGMLWESELEPVYCIIAMLLGTLSALLARLSLKKGSSRLAKVVVVLAVVCVVLSGVFLSVSQERDFGAAQKAASCLKKIVSANKEFAIGHGGAYARDLSELRVSHSAFRYKITYSPREEAGNVKHYVLMATPRNKTGIFFYADEGGVITYEFKRPATSNNVSWPMTHEDAPH